MEIKYRQPKMKDSLYGEMAWDDEGKYEWFWFSWMSDETYGKFEILIVASTPADFMATRNTHSTYKKLIAEMPRIQKEAVLELMRNGEIAFAKKRHRKFAVEKLIKTLELVSITIYQDLSSKICFDSTMFEENYDEVIFVYLEPDRTIETAEVGYF